MTYHILVAEDDRDINKLVSLYLENEGYIVHTAENGKDALDIIETRSIDLVILDIMMPIIDGFAVTSRIRGNYNVPILLLTAKGEMSDKIRGLNLGADDYITKPFEPLELIARVKSQLRRNNMLYGKAKTLGVLDVGAFILEVDNYRFLKNGIAIPLTPIEFKIMSVFMTSPGRVFTKIQMYESVIGDHYLSDDNTMSVHIFRLREKIENDPKNPQYIRTVRGIGYKFEIYSQQTSE